MMLEKYNCRCIVHCTAHIYVSETYFKIHFEVHYGKKEEYRMPSRDGSWSEYQYVTWLVTLWRHSHQDRDNGDQKNIF